MADDEELKAKPKSKRIFINHLDTYHSNHIGRFLANCVSGATLNEEEEEEEEGENNVVQKEGLFEIVGTLLNENYDRSKFDFAKRIIKFDQREELFKSLSEVDVIIYNTLDDEFQLDEGEWLNKKLYDEAETVTLQKQFIMLSSVMTWAKTKQLEPEEDTELPFTEEDYRRRRPHPNFLQHLQLEKNVIKRGNLKKEKLITYVVASGLTYGCGENVLHFFFKNAWENAPNLEVFGSGQNILPTIHIRDLAGVLQNLIDARPKTRYLLATDDAKNNLEEIVKAISKSLTTGKVKTLTKEEALVNEEVEQTMYDQLLLNLQIDPVFVKENMKIKWFTETGIVENINKIVKEFKAYRNLIPFRMCLLGPPAIGKSVVSEQLSVNYRLHWILLKEVIEQTMIRLERSAARVEMDTGDAGGDEEGADEDAADKAADDAELLESVNESKAENEGRIEQQFITKFLKQKLLSKPCRNQGYILDNYPKTKDQAEELFNVGEDDEEEEEEEGEGGDEDDEEKPVYNRNLLPTHVFVLEADDDFLRRRVMALPEDMVTGTHNTETDFLRRLRDYRQTSNDEDTVLNYFEDNGVRIVKIEVMKDELRTIKKVEREIEMVLGSSRNYHPTAAQVAAEKRMKQEEEESKKSMMSEEKKRRKQEEERLREERREQWSKKLHTLKKEEEDYLDEKSLPLRNYLMRHVMPVLTEGLIDCVKNRPDNAVDYLAEFLFKNNPQYD